MLALQASGSQSQLAHLQQEVSHVAEVLRSLLIATSSTFHQLHDPAPSASNDGTSGTQRSSAAQLQELVDVLAAELNKRSTAVAESSGRCRAQEAALAQREDEVKALEARLK